MSEPKIADTKPALLELEAGEYYWCSCGESKNQPFCDGSHKEAGEFHPVPFTLQKKKTVALCQCKRTKTPPYCDGSHSKL